MKERDVVIRLESVVLSDAFISFQLAACAKPVNIDPDETGHDRGCSPDRLPMSARGMDSSGVVESFE